MGVLVEINATVTCLVVVKDPILTYIAGIRETCCGRKGVWSNRVEVM